MFDRSNWGAPQGTRCPPLVHLNGGRLMDRRDQELLDKQLSQINDLAPDEGKIVLMFVGVFLAGVFLGAILLGHGGVL